MATTKKKPTTKTTDEKKVVEQPKTEQKVAVETPKNEPTISVKDYEKVLKENSKMKDEISALKKKILSIMEEMSLNESALEKKTQECERLKHRTFWQRLTNKTEDL